MSRTVPIFFSYARQDSDLALELAKKLRSEGILLWIDQLDIPAGVRWDREIETVLRQSQAMLVVLSPAAVESENVLDEIGFALEKGMTVVPVICRPCKIPIRLRRLQHIDLSGESADLDQLAGRLREIAGEAEDRGSAPRAVPSAVAGPEAQEPLAESRRARAASRSHRPLVLGAAALLILVAVLLYWFWPRPLAPLDQQEVLRGFRQAIGGEEAWRAISTVVAQGTYSTEAVEAPITVTFKKPEKLRFDMTLGDAQSIQAYDGQTAWGLRPGAAEPELLPPWAGRNLLAALEIETPLINTPRKEHVVELLGEEIVEGRQAYVLSVELRGGDQQLWYLDAETFLPIKSRGPALLMEGQLKVDVDTFYRDFRDLGGLSAYHRFDVVPPAGQPGYTVSFEKVKLNVPVADEFFEMPAAAAVTAEPPAAAEAQPTRASEEPCEVRFNTRGSLTGDGEIVQIWNASTPAQVLTGIRVEIIAPNGDQRTYAEEHLAKGFFEIGHKKLDGWRIRSGYRVRVRCEQYAGRAEYRVP